MQIKKYIKIFRKTEIDAFCGTKLRSTRRKYCTISLLPAVFFLRYHNMMEMKGKMKLTLFIFAIRALPVRCIVCLWGIWAMMEKITAKRCTSSMSFHFAFKGLRSIANRFDHFSTYFRSLLCHTVRALNR